MGGWVLQKIYRGNKTIFRIRIRLEPELLSGSRLSWDIQFFKNRIRVFYAVDRKVNKNRSGYLTF
jgi:hypothetical protein